MCVCDRSGVAICDRSGGTAIAADILPSTQLPAAPVTGTTPATSDDLVRVEKGDLPECDAASGRSGVLCLFTLTHEALEHEPLLRPQDARTYSFIDVTMTYGCNISPILHIKRQQHYMRVAQTCTDLVVECCKD